MKFDFNEENVGEYVDAIFGADFKEIDELLVEIFSIHHNMFGKVPEVMDDGKFYAGEYLSFMNVQLLDVINRAIKRHNDFINHMLKDSKVNKEGLK